VAAFEYQRSESLEMAIHLLQRPGAVPLGGGTDLFVGIREGIARPELLVDLRNIPGAGELVWTPAEASASAAAPSAGASPGVATASPRKVAVASGDEGVAVRIGAAVRIADLADDARVRAHFPALAMACEAVGSLALRNMGTLGGNLCQRPRCWYFRSGVSCFKSGGDSCPAAEGENQYHAIFGGGPCHIVHPSDPAVALTALDAVVHVAGGGDGAPTASPRTRAIPIAGFFVLPSEKVDSETVLQPGEFVTHVEIPAYSSGSRQRYVKLMQRGAWDFALASLAAVRRRDGAVRLVLGGVAPKPWRVDTSVEEDVASGALSDDDIETLAERALYDARPLAKNGYKIRLAKTLLRRGMVFLTHS
jgi:xanthine dehydrogenase YagS FAD-binding subunit